MGPSNLDDLARRLNLDINTARAELEAERRSDRDVIRIQSLKLDRLKQLLEAREALDVLIKEQ